MRLQRLDTIYKLIFYLAKPLICACMQQQNNRVRGNLVRETAVVSLDERGRWDGFEKNPPWWLFSIKTCSIDGVSVSDRCLQVTSGCLLVRTTCRLEYEGRESPSATTKNRE